ncbi:hypothetical protein PFISCL1PPCAC_15140, partial [Pristionchus fissidentatus]
LLLLLLLRLESKWIRREILVSEGILLLLFVVNLCLYQIVIRNNLGLALDSRSDHRSNILLLPTPRVRESVSSIVHSINETSVE